MQCRGVPAAPLPESRRNATDASIVSYPILAALGCDLGPRLLPIGSLVGLFWTHQLRQKGVIGAIVTVPSLLASLAALWLGS